MFFRRGTARPLRAASHTLNMVPLLFVSITSSKSQLSDGRQESSMLPCAEARHSRGGNTPP